MRVDNVTVTGLEPRDAATAATMLADAASAHIALVPEGHRTKLLDVDPQRSRPISTRHLTAGLAHYAGDLVATVPAGMTLREANAALAGERQWIPLDPRFADAATIGGIVATNDSGPHRHRYGTPRDLVIGMEVALTTGQVAHSGGRVVKNVAGYDLARLFCGSHGSLGLITSVTFKLAPMAPASCTVVGTFETPRHVCEAAMAISTMASLSPAAIELLSPDPRLLVRFETTERAASRMAQITEHALADRATRVVTLTGDGERELWDTHQRLESTRDGMLTSVIVLPVDAGKALADVDTLGARFGVTASVAGRAALGVLRVHTLGDAAAQLQFAVALRTAIARHHGRTDILNGPAAVVSSVDRFGPPGSAAPIAFSVKQRFDPATILPYPWSRG